MKKILTRAFFCCLLFYSFPVCAQSLEEYINAENARIGQVQQTELAVQNFIEANFEAYNISQELIDGIISNLQTESAYSEEALQEAIGAVKRAGLRKVYFEENPDALLLYQAGEVPEALRQTCINGDFEMGVPNYTFNSTVNNNLTSCNTPGATNSPDVVLVNNFAAGTTVSLMSYTPGSIPDDPLLAPLGVRIPVISPNGGNQCIRLSSSAADDARVTTMTRVMMITDPLLEYEFSVVMQNVSQHGVVQVPFFRVSIIAGGQTQVMRCFQAQPNCLLMATTDGPDGSFVYSGWVCDELNVSAFIGQQVTLEFTVGDCFWGPHYSTVYIDNICNFSCNIPCVLQLDEPNNDCTNINNNHTYQVCGNFSCMSNVTTPVLTIEISQNNGPFLPINNPQIFLNPNGTFCFRLLPSVFGTISNGNTYIFRVTANYGLVCPLITANSTTTAFVRVTFNNCCIPDLTLLPPIDNVSNADPPGMALREVQNWIRASNLVTVGNSIVGNGVIYKAGDFIELIPGFEALRLSQFSAYIADCPGNFNYRPTTTSGLPTPIIKEDNEMDKNESVVIYPNPASATADIVSRSGNFKSVSIYTIEGKQVYDMRFETANRLTVDIGRFAKGVYIVKVIAGDGKVFSKKLIKH